MVTYWLKIANFFASISHISPSTGWLMQNICIANYYADAR